MKRESNIELLRIVAMMLIVLLHCNYLSLGEIGTEEMISAPSNSFIRATAQQLCIVSVNVFILISGWFGIHPTLKGALSLLFQIFFFNTLIAGIFLFSGIETETRSIIDVFYFGAAYWFVTAYLILYAISPILNAFIATASPRAYAYILSAFFFLEFALGWAAEDSNNIFNHGYSAISFAGLYLLAAFLRRYSKRVIHLSSVKNFSLYLLFTFIPVAITFLLKHGIRTTSYINPFVIAASLFLFLTFNRMKFSSKAINYLASSAFSIYLVHQHPLIVAPFIELMRNSYELLGGALYIIFVIVFAIIGGFICILADKARIYLWKWLCRIFLDKILLKTEALFTRLFSRLGI